LQLHEVEKPICSYQNEAVNGAGKVAPIDRFAVCWCLRSIWCCRGYGHI